MTTASGNNHPLDRRPADQARLAFPSIHAMLELKEAGLAGGIHVVRYRRTTRGDRLIENLLHGFVVAVEFAA